MEGPFHSEKFAEISIAKPFSRVYMGVFDNAWSFLKALEEQQLHEPSTYSRGMAAMGAPPMIEGPRIKTMHPAIRGLMDRKLDYNTRNSGQSPKVTNTPQIQRENVEAWPKGYDPDADAELQAQEAYEQGQRQKQQERERQGQVI